MFSFNAHAPASKEQSGQSYAHALTRPATSDENSNKPPSLSSRNASGSSGNTSKVLAPLQAASQPGASSRSRKPCRSVDLNTLFHVPDYAQKRQSDAAEATKNLIEQHRDDAYAQERITLTKLVASARSAYPPKPVEGQVSSDSGNFGAALVDIRNVPEKLIASSYFWAKSPGCTPENPDSFQLYRIVRETENHRFKSRKVGDHLRNVDSEAKILNFIAKKLGGRSDASGTIVLYTEIPPCTSCTGVISAFKQAFPDIEIIVLNNESHRPGTV